MHVGFFRLPAEGEGADQRDMGLGGLGALQAAPRHDEAFLEGGGWREGMVGPVREFGRSQQAPAIRKHAPTHKYNISPHTPPFLPPINHLSLFVVIFSPSGTFSRSFCTMRVQRASFCSAPSTAI